MNVGFDLLHPVGWNHSHTPIRQPRRAMPRRVPLQSARNGRPPSSGSSSPPCSRPEASRARRGRRACRDRARSGCAGALPARRSIAAGIRCSRSMPGAWPIPSRPMRPLPRRRRAGDASMPRTRRFPARSRRVPAAQVQRTRRVGGASVARKCRVGAASPPLPRRFAGASGDLPASESSWSTARRRLSASARTPHAAPGP